MFKKFLKRLVTNETAVILYIYILRLVFIPYFKIAANRNKDLINNRNQVDFLNNK